MKPTRIVYLVRKGEPIRKTLEVGLFIFLAGHGSQTDRNEVDT